MTGEIYKEHTRQGERKYLKEMNKECLRFAKLHALKVNRKKEMSLVLAENADKFPWLMSQAVMILFNENPYQVKEAINLLVANKIKEAIEGGNYSAEFGAKKQ